MSVQQLYNFKQHKDIAEMRNTLMILLRSGYSISADMVEAIDTMLETCYISGRIAARQQALEMALGERIAGAH